MNFPEAEMINLTFYKFRDFIARINIQFSENWLTSTRLFITMYASIILNSEINFKINIGNFNKQYYSIIPSVELNSVFFKELFYVLVIVIFYQSNISFIYIITLLPLQPVCYNY